MALRASPSAEVALLRDSGPPWCRSVSTRAAAVRGAASGTSGGVGERCGASDTIRGSRRSAAPRRSAISPFPSVRPHPILF